jgi:hypothetical protein
VNEAVGMDILPPKYLPIYLLSLLYLIRLLLVLLDLRSYRMVQRDRMGLDHGYSYRYGY